MKIKLLLLTLLLAVSFVFPQIQIIDDFETGLGHFNLATGYSGSTKGIISFIPYVDSTMPAKNGTKYEVIKLIDIPGDTLNWFVRFLSGTGNPANNVVLNDTGWVGYWIKTNKSYLKCGFIMDDLSVPGPGVSTNEISDSLSILGNNQWNLYQWNMADSNRWFPFIATGNGMIQDPVSIDAIFFEAKHPAVNNDTATVYLDYVCFRFQGQLPVELVSFDAVIEKNQIDLRWITGTEINNSGFEIQRKFENETWQTIGFVKGKGTTSQPNGYTFTDKVEQPGNYYYRLKQVDFDGTFAYSNVVEVEIISVPGEYYLAQNYPNPFNPSTEIAYYIPEAGVVSLSVYNLVGEKVADLLNEVQSAGTHLVKFNASSLSTGIYIYNLNVNGKSLAKKMTLVK
jgi:hypothetical protein